MDLLVFMLPFMLALGGAFLGLFLWAVKGAQYDDPEGDKLRIFMD
jgi:cbb3-type cytochrome oxidase maturation protein